MTDFVCRTHNAAFRSLASLGAHIDKHHASEGTIHCVYRDPDDALARAKTRSAKRASDAATRDIRGFLGEGFKRFVHPKVPQKTAVGAQLLSLLEMRHEFPRMIVEAVRGMKSRKMRALYPDLHMRYAEVMKSIPGPTPSIHVKQAVFSLLLPS